MNLTYAEASDKCVVIDVNKVITQSKAYKHFKVLWDRENSKYQKEVEFYESQVMKLDKQISTNPDNLTPESLQTLKQQLGSHEIKIQKLIQKRKQHLDESFANAMEKLRVSLNKVVYRYAEINKVTLVIPKSYTIYIAKNIDITDIILENLNKELEKIDTNLR